MIDIREHGGSFGGGKGGLSIKKFQQGEAIMSGNFIDITINSIDISKTFAMVNAVIEGGTSSSLSNIFVGYELLNSTTIRIKRGTLYGTAKPLHVTYQIYECDGIKPIQRGQAVISNALSDTYYHYYTDVAINTIKPEKTLLNVHMYSDDTSTSNVLYSTRKVLINPSTLRFYAYTFNNQKIVYDVIEIK